VANAIRIDVTEIEAAAKALLRIDQDSLQDAALRAVNGAAQRGFDRARQIMLAGVNLTDDYVRAQMDVELATGKGRPVAQIIAFRAGGKRPATRAINLRRFDPRQLEVISNWTNAGVNTKSGARINANARLENPRKPGTTLPFKKRVGAKHLGLAVGRKQAGLTVEVRRGQRKELAFAFMAPARKGAEAGGQGLLVFSRDKGDRKGKGKLRPIYSLSVWQMFRHSLPQVIPFVANDLERGVIAEIEKQIQKVVNG
jgi:hypothetical protein